MHCFRNIKNRGSVSRETLPRYCLYTIRLKKLRLLQHGLLNGEVYRNAAPHYQIQLALDQRQEVCHCFVTDVVSCRRNSLGRNFSRLAIWDASAGSIVMV